jgi:hypothetical protein
MFRRRVKWLALSMCLIACDEHKGADEPVEPEEEIGQRQQGLILAAGRTVAVLVNGEEVEDRAEDVAHNFGMSCLRYMSGRAWVTRNTENPRDPFYIGQCTTEPISDGFVRGQSMRSRDLIAQVALCVGQLTLQVSRSPVAGHIVQVGDELTFVEQVPEGAIRRFSVGPPRTASHAATWALLAADKFREAAEHFATVLDRCPEALGNDAEHVFDGVQYNTKIATQLSESLAGMVEAAEASKEFVSAAAQAKQSEGDPIANRVAAWLDRHDSRLEGASIFVPIHGSRYARKLVPIYEMRNVTTGQFYYTGDPNPKPGFERSTTYGELTPPLGYGLEYADGSAAPRMSRLMQSFRRTEGTGASATVVTRTFTTNGSGWTQFSTPTDQVYVFAGYREHLQLIPCKLWQTTNTTGPRKYRWVRAGETGGQGWQESPEAAFMYVFPYAGAPNYPLVTTDLSSEAQERAMELLRVLRVDPRAGRIVNNTSRTEDDIINDLQRALAEDYGRVYDAPADTVLYEIGLERSDVLTAARRLVEEARVLGRAIVDDATYNGEPASESRRVWGTNEVLTPPHPALIYARTAGFLGSGLATKPESPGYEEPDVTYARTSITATLDYVRSLLSDNEGNYDRAGLSPAANTMLQSALQLTQRYLGPRTRVAFDTDPGTALPYTDHVRIYLQGLGYAASDLARAKEEIEIWNGEAGFECALLGSVGGAPCTPSEHLYTETPGSGLADWAIEPSNNELRIVIHRVQAPNGRMRLDVPVFVTRKTKGGLQVLTAFYPENPTSWDWLYLPPYSDWLAENLGDLLAVNPSDPSQADVDCVGLKTNLTLEDELSEGQTGRDDIESSYAYYLNAARDAATHADNLADALIQQGLDLDIRSEAARAELENLCGGVVNLESLSSEACNQHECDIAKTLKADPDMPDGNPSLHSCLVPEASTDDVSLGESPLCVYEIAGGPPCVGEYRAAGDREPIAQQCPVLLDGMKDPNNTPADPSDDVRKECTDVMKAAVDGTVVAFRELTALNMVPTFEPDPVQNESECAQLLAFSAAHKNGSGWKFAYSKSQLQNIAKMLSLSIDRLGNPVVERMGAPWLQILKPSATTSTLPDKFPCRPLDGTSWNINPTLLGQMCAGAQDGDEPLFCGLACDDGVEAGRRLEDAVLTLRYMAGAGLDGVMHSIESRDLSGQPIWYKGYDVTRIWHPDVVHEMAQFSENYNYPLYTENSGSLAVFTELSSLIGRPLRASHSQNNDAMEMVGEVGDASYGSVATFDGHGYETGSFTFKGKLAERASGSIVCDTHCDRIEIDGHMRDMLAKNEYQFEGNEARAIVDWGDLARGNLATFWTPVTARYWTGADAERWKVVENRVLPQPVDLETGEPLNSSIQFPRSSGSPERRYSGELTFRDVMDALEVACLVQHPPESITPSCGQLKAAGTLQVAGLRDYGKVSKALQCKANELLKYASAQYIWDAPKDVVTALREGATANIYPNNQGELALAITDFMSSLNGVMSAVKGMAKIVGDASNAVASTENQMRILGYRYNQAVESAAAQVAQQEANCMAAKINAIPDVSVTFGGSSPYSASVSPTAILKNGLLAGATCSNSAVQQGHAKRIAALEGKIELAEETAVLLGLQQTMSELSFALDETNRAFLEQHAKVQASVAKIASIRSRASRAAATALLLDNDDMGREFQATTTMHARFNTLQMRYTQALDDAKKLAYLARRSIEQKVGMDLGKIHQPLPLVDAPAKWVNTLCERKGINYEDVRSNDGMDDALNDENGYAEEYIGDYVTKLENFLKSYSLAYPYQDADDLAVVSVRDELIRTRAICEETGWNELLYTDGASFGSAERPDEGWERTCSLDAGLRAWLLPGGPGPFQCSPNNPSGPSDSTPFLCNSLGSAQAISLSSVASDTCDPGGTEGDTEPAAPPAEELAYWLAADSCLETIAGSGVLASCTDLSGNGRTLTGPATLIASGVGGKPSISSTGVLSVAKTPAATDRFTVSYVVRPIGTTTQRLWRALDTQSDGSTREAYLSFDSSQNLSFVMQPNSGSTLPSTHFTVPVGNAPPHLSSAGMLVTLRADASNGIEIFVDGKRWAGSPFAAYAVKLGGQIANGSAAAPMVLSETLAYTRALSDGELSQLHRYLAARYDIDLKAADAWLDADDLHVMRTSTGGVSSQSGYAGDATNYYDRASGLTLIRNGGMSSLTPFSFGHRGVEFDGSDDHLRWPSFGGSCSRPSHAVNTCPPNARVHVSEYALTVVARFENALRDQTLYTNGSSVRLVANASNGTIGLKVTKPTGTESYVSPVGTVAASTPFIVTMRASASRGRTDVFVNGVKQASWPGFEHEASDRYLGRHGADWFRGAMAQVQVHARNLSDTAIGSLHSQLGQDFDIQVWPTSSTGDVASGGPARVRQWASVLGGQSYLFSWYQPKDDVSLRPIFDMPDGSVVMGPEPLSLASCTQTPDPADCERDLHPQWKRYFVEVAVAMDGWMGFGLPTPTTAGRSQLIAAPQVELTAPNQSVAPLPFFPTDDDFKKPVGLCEDSSGEVFRTMWKRGCESYCPPGTGRSCSHSGQPTGLAQRCFRELNFDIMLEDIERGLIVPEAGFALGNFNYRFDQIAVNLVGTSIKNCELSDNPSACYANNHLPYSLRHDGPFRVRNYQGNVYRAPLFPGNIQQSNALVAERYISNPISSSDRNLLADFWDDEFRGRPIDGNYVLRVYETDALDWEKLEDVQLMLKYRYWTRFE